MLPFCRGAPANSALDARRPIAHRRLVNTAGVDASGKERRPALG